MIAIQCRMARAALQIGIIEVAAMAKVAPGTISRLEAGEELKPRTIEVIRHAFERAGIIFIDGDEPGVKLAKKKRGSR
jgi:transcriptional regulator with XRE-family HTH domain